MFCIVAFKSLSIAALRAKFQVFLGDMSDIRQFESFKPQTLNPYVTERQRVKACLYSQACGADGNAGLVRQQCQS